jgi:myosin-5
MMRFLAPLACISVLMMFHMHIPFPSPSPLTRKKYTSARQATIGFTTETITSLLRLIAAILHCGNITFTATHQSDRSGMSDACAMDSTRSSLAAARLLGVSPEDLAYALTYRAIRAGNEVVHSPLDRASSQKACEALMKATYGAVFDYIVTRVNESISNQNNHRYDDHRHRSSGRASGCASIGVLDIFGFETFECNSFEQICINYTNEALQQQFNKYVFKLEQDGELRAR